LLTPAGRGKRIGLLADYREDFPGDIICQIAHVQINALASPEDFGRMGRSWLEVYSFRAVITIG
jgi:hypothetical protein